MNTVPSVCPKGTRRCSVWEKPAQVIKGLVMEKIRKKYSRGKNKQLQGKTNTLKGISVYSLRLITCNPLTVLARNEHIPCSFGVNSQES